MFKQGLTIGCSAAILSFAAHAATETNTMTNIATVVGGCDIVAIGANYGVIQSPMTAADTDYTANTATGNAAAANPDHDDISADGVSPDDDLTLSTGVTAIDTVLTPLVSALVGAAPGVYVACTKAPTSVTVSSATTAAVTLGANNLDTTDFDSTMTLVGGSDTLNYETQFTTAVVDTTAVPVISAYLATFTLVPSADNNIPVQADLVSGNYTDVVTATVNF